MMFTIVRQSNSHSQLAATSLTHVTFVTWPTSISQTDSVWFTHYHHNGLEGRNAEIMYIVRTSEKFAHVAVIWVMPSQATRTNDQIRCIKLWSHQALRHGTTTSYGDILGYLGRSCVILAMISGIVGYR